MAGSLHFATVRLASDSRLRVSSRIAPARACTAGGALRFQVYTGSKTRHHWLRTGLQEPFAPNRVYLGAVLGLPAGCHSIVRRDSKPPRKGLPDGLEE
jgi:hypothetical protein